MSKNKKYLYCPLSGQDCKGSECALAVFKSGYATDIWACGLSINDQYSSQVIDTVYKKSNNELHQT